MNNLAEILEVRKTSLFAPFTYKSVHFAKTGSGQTRGKVVWKKRRFGAGGSHRRLSRGLRRPRAVRVLSFPVYPYPFPFMRVLVPSLSWQIVRFSCILPRVCRVICLRVCGSCVHAEFLYILAPAPLQESTTTPHDTSASGSEAGSVEPPRAKGTMKEHLS